MSDFRFASYWVADRRVMRLSGDDFKAFVLAGSWMVENRTDGHIAFSDIDLVPTLDTARAERLAASGVWCLDEEGGGWRMVDYDRTQTSRAEFEVLDNARRRERLKKARRRAKDHAVDGVPGDVPGDMSRGTTQDRQGKARTGEEGPEGGRESWFDDTAAGAVGAGGGRDGVVREGNRIRFQGAA